MVKHCIAYNCHNKQKRDVHVTYHRLPLSAKRQKFLSKWLDAMKLKNPPINKDSRLCSAHFTPDCFKVCGNTKTLKEDAVPSIFSFDTKIPPTTTRRSTKRLLSAGIQSISYTNTEVSVVSLDPNLDHTKIESSTHSEPTPHCLKKNNNKNSKPGMMENELETNTSIQNKETVFNDIEKQNCDQRNESEENDEYGNKEDEESIDDDDISDEEIFECSCSKVFLDLEKYKKHKLKCKKNVDIDFEVSDNEIDEPESIIYACYPCDQIYDDPADLKKHNGACHPVISEEHPDSVIGLQESAEGNKLARTITIGWINSKGEVVRDKTIIYKKITKCEECGDYLKGRTSYMVHKLKHENDKAGISYECRRCQEIFKCEPDLQVHENALHCADHLPFKCHHCHEKFLTLVATDSHMLYTHGDDGGRFPFKCYECSDVFTKNEIFYQHMISHSNETSKRTIKCKVCKKKFYAEGGGYQRHINMHTKYPCEICGKLFSKHGLPKHMRSHEEVKRYECPVCNKRFAQQNNQKKHMRVHSGIKPYECDICQKTYNHKVSLKTHKKRAHNIDWWEENGVKKPEDICGKTPIWKPLRK